MADAVVSLVLESISELLINTVADEIDLLSGVETEVTKLASNFKKIRGVLDDAEERMIKDSNVKDWLEELEDICYDMDDILDEWNTMILKRQLQKDVVDDTPKKKNVCSFISSSCFCVKNVGCRRDIAIRIRSLNGRLDSVINEMSRFKFVSNSLGSSISSQDWKRVSSTSMVDVSKVRGRDSDLGILIQKLVGESSSGGDASGVKVISIVGLGGIGKTTVAQLVCNDNRVESHFDQQIWVCVSDPFDEIKIARAIIQSLEKKAPNLDELDPLLKEIKRLMAGKRFILVLDDVWTEDYTKFEPFLISLKDGSHGSMILLTTRSIDVARAFRSTYMHKVAILEESESWSLFCQIAFSGENGNKREELEVYGKEIIKKCNGLPLAINTIASLLRLKSSANEWRMISRSSIWDLEIAEVQLFPHLYLSYKNLAAPLKRCFTFCAVFPKDERIDVDKLIKMWIAEGYLGRLSSEDNIDLEARGREYFETLARLSFFQNFSSSFEDKISECTMHDIVHDFAQYLKKGKVLVVEVVSKLLDENKAIGSKNLRHVNFHLNGKIPYEYTPKINSHPRGFLLKELGMKRLNFDILSSLSNVRELRLNRCKLTDIPNEIEKLIHLRYLDLSDNKTLEVLPTTISNLCNLHTLDISKSRITCLPQGSEKLISLRHFIFKKYFEESHTFYLEGVSKLTRLKSLVGNVTGDQLCWLENLNQLGGELHIEFDRWFPTQTRHKVELGSKFCLHGLDITFRTPQILDPPPNLQELSISFVKEVVKFPILITSILVNLKRLHIYHVSDLLTLPPLGKLPVLEKLLITHLFKLKFLGRSFLGLEGSEEGASSWSGIGFPKLKELDFTGWKMWEEWEHITEEEEKDTKLSIMPRLQTLRLRYCSTLKALPHRLLRKASSLEIVELGPIKCTPSQVLNKPQNEHWWSS